MGGLWVQANGGGTCNQIRVRDCKFEQSAFVGEPILIEGARSVHFSNIYGYMGGFGSGYSSATDFMYLSSAQDSSVIGVHLAQANTAGLTRSVVACAGNVQRGRIDGIIGTFPQNPTAGLLRFGGASNTVRLGRTIEYQQGSGAIMSGTPDYPFEVEGAGSPEGVVTAPIGSRYWRTDGSTSTTLYVKTSGTGNTGWTAK